MEIRLLQETELAWAVNTANEVYGTCVKPYAGTQEEVSQYYGYVNAEYFWQEMHDNRLFLWGAFEEGMMCAVSAMQNVGHITMLYVRPEFWHRRIGMQMLHMMRVFAASMLHLSRITVNVAPLSAVPFFNRLGFCAIPLAGGHTFYLSMESRWDGKTITGGNSYADGTRSVPKREEITYPTKPVSPKVVLFLTAAVLALSFVIMSVFTIHHMATEDRNAGESHYDEDLPEGMGGAVEL